MKGAGESIHDQSIGDKGLTQWSEVVICSLFGEYSSDLNVAFGYLNLWNIITKRWNDTIDIAVLHDQKFLIKPIYVRVLTKAEMDLKVSAV